MTLVCVMVVLSLLFWLCYCFDCPNVLMFFFFKDSTTTEIYTLSLHDALPISETGWFPVILRPSRRRTRATRPDGRHDARRSEEHTSELQSRQYLVCRLLLEKKKEQTQHR